jgi:hypothetical protein
MTQAIVINLGSEVNDDELEMGNVWSLPGLFVQATPVS